MSAIYDYRVEILREIFGDVKYNSNSHETFMFCPNGCHDKKRKLQINIKKNTGQCWVCGGSGKGGIKGNIFYFLNRFASRSQKKKYLSTIDFKVEDEYGWLDVGNTHSLDLPESYRFVFDGDSHTKDLALDYLINEMGLSDEVILQNQIGYCDTGEFADRVVFPSFGENGKLNYYVGKTLVDDFPKYKDVESEIVRKRDIVFNELFVNWRKPLILVEGAPARLKHFSVPNVIPLLGSPKLGERYRLFQSIIMNGVREVYLGYDPEAIDKEVETSENLKEYGIETKFLLLDSQPDEISTEEFQHHIAEAKELEIDPLEMKLRGW